MGGLSQKNLLDRAQIFGAEERRASDQTGFFEKVWQTSVIGLIPP